MRSGRARPAAITRSRPIRWWSKPAARLHRADTLAGLAGKIGLAPERLNEVVGEYNKAVEQGTLQKLSPARGDAPHKAWPIKTAPFYAMPICAAITNTMGGIVVDGDARVLDLDDKPIAGLYAAGSTVGGLDGGPHAGYVGGLIKATIGLRAAETIAAQELGSTASGFSPPSPARCSRPRRPGRICRTARASSASARSRGH